jgi:hypothetical protein
MPEIELQRLRKLRGRAQELLNTLVADLKPFRSIDKDYGFRRTPEKPQAKGDVNVTTTCSCLMGLAHSGKVEEFYKLKATRVLPTILANMMKVPWKSSGLEENNAFTTTLVVRLCGLLVESNHLTIEELQKLNKVWELDSENCTSEGKTIASIAQHLSSKIENFKINDYPPAAAIVYWFLDGVDRAHFDIGDGWSVLYRFAAEEFRRQRSLVVAKHTAMMDPVAMAMAACLCARLRSVSKRSPSAQEERQREVLPSMIELERAVVELFSEQTPTGLWSKYFPLFHYNEAGSNFCYTFELLEAVLLEFGGKDSTILLEDTVILGLEKAVTSCETNRLECNGPKDGDVSCEWVPYIGWNSGGNFKTLLRGQPESWATAVVHMFLRELVEVLSDHIQSILLKRYNATLPNANSKRIDDLLDISVILDNKSLKGTLKESLVKTFSRFKGDRAMGLRKAPIQNAPMSALLFGPPGTSKTQVAKAIAADLQWPLVEIDPSHFLQTTFQDIYFQASRIFEDVMDMCGVVVLFDEMDALVQKRGGGTPSDTESKFLTTYMLPKLAKLHDKGQLIFLMATNFQEEFDEAIKRAGRFDLLLCMGPPTLQAKCDNLRIFLQSGQDGSQADEKPDQSVAAGKLIQEFVENDPWTANQLALYTFGEFRSLVSRLGKLEDIETKLRELKAAGFAEAVKKHAAGAGLRLEDLKKLEDLHLQTTRGPLDYRILADLDEVDLRAEDLERAKIPVTKAIRHILERRQSKYQS